MQRPLLSSLAGLFLLAAPSHALTVLVIDISNPAAVTFTATTNASTATSTLSMGSHGFSILNFFATDVFITNTTSVSGNLTTPGSPFFYEGLGTFDYDANNGNFVTANDISVYTNGGAPGDGSQVFTSGSRAFTGVLTADLSAYQSALPAIGSSGDIVSGFRLSGLAGHGLTVGQFTVIPEPSSALLGGLGALALLKRRRKA